MSHHLFALCHYLILGRQLCAEHAGWVEVQTWDVNLVLLVQRWGQSTGDNKGHRLDVLWQFTMGLLEYR